MLARRIFPLLLTCALAAATGCDTLDGAEFGNATSALDSDAEQLAEDDSAGAGEDEDLEPTLLVQCSQPVLCDAMPLHGDENGAVTNDASVAAYSDTERCVLESLARGEPALIQTVADFENATAFLDFALVGSDAALRQAHGDGVDVGIWTNNPYRCELRPRDYFQDCLDNHDPGCLQPSNWVERCEDLGALICPE
ncbi:MAG: hypothetical protein H6713_05435 [Myxococcales bacterium]|nr:hypothetical protein [Myxococcales bacterium]MCB9749438.1 hypothetical protein [Myxococcales bacterium]